MKIIAFYLPQFHEIEENNKWWGKGFTEWHNVKKAKPLFEEHYQPREPLNNNYYDLSEVSTLKWQKELMAKYDVYGLCFYHYWFEDGKQLLEKPAELLLKNKDIDMNFCFSWANEPWTRSWDGKNGEIIMNQNYGEEKEWINHFNYLSNFFKDERYIKIDNKPVFIIYKESSIPNLDNMMTLWNDLSSKEGFNGIYFINTLRSREQTTNALFSNNVEFEPAYTTSNLSNKTLNKRRVYRYWNMLLGKIIKNNRPYNLPYNYDEITKKSLSKQPLPNTKTIPGAFIEWDNTPRKGRLGTYYNGFTPEKFKKYLTKKIEKGIKDYNSEFLFINAWNEWAEGTYLEPDKKNEYKILEAVKEAVQKNKGQK